jgi:hypothetical protein
VSISVENEIESYVTERNFRPRFRVLRVGRLSLVHVSEIAVVKNSSIGPFDRSHRSFRSNKSDTPQANLDELLKAAEERMRLEMEAKVNPPPQTENNRNGL